MVSIVYRRRSIRVYFTLLEKKGNSNLAQQQQVLLPVFELLKDYKITVLGDREFCGVELGRWLLQEQKVNFSLRLRKNGHLAILRFPQNACPHEYVEFLRTDLVSIV